MTDRPTRRTILMGGLLLGGSGLLGGLALGLAPLAAPAASESVTLTRNGERHELTIDPATRGFRTSWDGGDGSYRFNIDAEGPDGTYSVSGTVEDGQAGDGFLFAPGLPGLGNAPGVTLRLSRLLLRGSNLRLRGVAESAEAGIRVDFDVTLAPLNFAPTPAPSTGPLD
ncbi:hypothetical protein [Pararhodobacter aggregans]|uniref:Uncharacterized protein n=1 Tax=Pararhodobacter aggregans TaxID=404875 RepID=A0A2T7UQG2_9RHOB|nr:hypothetical protein [Pararhodobacter aggregans]PTX01566.1 hypothetical protein C8N33_107132 [Pararhodobacter aggregans]PVE46831.1 hypothetical protein DDE23_14195 [Pararhodobacter aggregans]